MNKYWEHFKLINKHKYYVFKASCKAGIPLRGIMHDMSKYTPSEFLEYGKYFTGKGSPVNECKRINGYCAAWQHHKGHNPHHWHYWIDQISEEGGVGLIIPYQYAVEMMCDWIGAGQSYEEDSWTFDRPYDWFQTQELDRKKIHPRIVEFIDTVFLNMKEDKSYAALKKENTKFLYDTIVKFDK